MGGFGAKGQKTTWAGPLLQMELPAAPFFWSDIGDRFGEIPIVAVEVSSVVLTLAVGLILGLGQDHRTILPRALTVPLGVFNANLDDMRLVGREVAFRDGEASLAGFHLNAVVRNAQSDTEPERFG